MSNESEITYYERRQREEREFADTATLPSAIATHRALAVEYARKVAELRMGADAPGRHCARSWARIRIDTRTARA